MVPCVHICFAVKKLGDAARPMQVLGTTPVQHAYVGVCSVFCEKLLNEHSNAPGWVCGKSILLSGMQHASDPPPSRVMTLHLEELCSYSWRIAALNENERSRSFLVEGAADQSDRCHSAGYCDKFGSRLCGEQNNWPCHLQAEAARARNA